MANSILYASNHPLQEPSGEVTGMSGRSIIIAICAVLALAAASVPALAGERSGTETIYGMDPFYIEFENTGSEEMKVTWDIKLTDGVPINVVLLDEDNFEKYPYLGYEAYKGQRYDYVNSSKRTVKVEQGKYRLAIESAHSSMDSSTIDYEVKWAEDASLLPLGVAANRIFRRSWVSRFLTT